MASFATGQSKRKLAAETETFELLSAQARPQPDFGIRRREPKLARKWHGYVRMGHGRVVTPLKRRRYPLPATPSALPTSPSRGEGLPYL
jgi:hypothetical protein